MRAEEEYIDVLQNIENAAVVVCHKRPDLSDRDVIRAYEALIDLYRGEGIGRPPRDWRPSPLEHEVLDRVKEMCDWRLGRLDTPPTKGGPAARPAPISVDALVKCLKRLLHSAEKWNRSHGRQGYLNLISEYVK
jgi:hypothetical protein